MRLRLEFSHLNEHKFRHGFKDTLNPLCTCGAEVETTEDFLLHCQLYSTHRSELFDKILKIDSFESDYKRTSTCVIIRFTKK